MMDRFMGRVSVSGENIQFDIQNKKNITPMDSPHKIVLVCVCKLLYLQCIFFLFLLLNKSKLRYV